MAWIQFAHGRVSVLNTPEITPTNIYLFTCHVNKIKIFSREKKRITAHPISHLHLAEENVFYPNKAFACHKRVSPALVRHWIKIKWITRTGRNLLSCVQHVRHQSRISGNSYFSCWRIFPPTLPALEFYIPLFMRLEFKRFSSFFFLFFFFPKILCHSRALDKKQSSVSSLPSFFFEESP